MARRPLMHLPTAKLSLMIAAHVAANTASAPSHTVGPPDWTTIASITGAVLTAMTGMITLYFQNRTTQAAAGDQALRATLAGLSEDSPSARAVGAASLATFARDESRRSVAIEALCNAVRFDRDIYVIDAAVRALREIQAIDPATTEAIHTLKSDLYQDLIRQIAQYAKGPPELSKAQLAENVRSIASEAPDLVDSVFADGNSNLINEMRAQSFLTPPGDDNERKWSVKITARSMQRLNDLLSDDKRLKNDGRRT